MGMGPLRRLAKELKTSVGGQALAAGVGRYGESMAHGISRRVCGVSQGGVGGGGGVGTVLCVSLGLRIFLVPRL